MSLDVKDRIFGVETEFGCLTDGPYEGRTEEVVELIKDYVFHELRLGVIDLHARDEVFEPAECGGFMVNGSRFYIDAVGSHLEYATAECRSLKDLVANDRAGHRIILRAIRELGLSEHVQVYNNSVDHFHGHTFGCHENYLVRMTENFFSEEIPLLFPFLVTRQIFAGSGRVGGHILVAGNRYSNHDDNVHPIDVIWTGNTYHAIPDDSVTYQLSQRADHIIRLVASRVRFNRAIVNPKWEHFYAHEGYNRLHLLYGECNQNPYAYALKVGTTSLCLRLIEDGLVPADWQLLNPLIALREVSRDPTYRWIVMLADGSTISAVDLQRKYLRLAESYRGSTPDTDWVLDNWASTLDQLEKDPLELSHKLDWVAKLKLVEMYRESEGLEPGADPLHSIDLEYHNIDMQRSLFYALQQAGEVEPYLDDLDVLDAMSDPPSNTRAYGRSKLVQQVLKRKRPGAYHFEWSAVMLGRNNVVELSDPFHPYGELSSE